MGERTTIGNSARRSANGKSEGGFSGFSRQGLDFLRELERHNERPWFLERKALYEAEIERPLHALVAELSQRCARAKVPLAPNPRRPSFRIYRDVRFSADKRPYKTFAGAALYRDGDKSNPGGLYLHVDPHESFVAAGFYAPEAPVLRALREGMAGDPKTFLKVVALLRKRDLALASEDALKRIPREYSESAGTGIEPYLKLRSIFTQRRLEPEVVRGATLGDLIAGFVKDSAPLLRWGWQQISS